MRKPEQRLWDRMRKIAPAASQATRLERIENIVGEGIPDVLAISNGLVTFCELKWVADFPVREATRVLGEKGLNRAQRNWHHDWHVNGGRSIILIGVGATHTIAISGGLADIVNSMSQEQLYAHAVGRGWAQIFNYLTGTK